MTSKSSDYGPVASLLDLVGAVTGYNEAAIPAGEVLACYRTISKIVRYMTLRAAAYKNGQPNHESLQDTVMDIVGESARLYAAYRGDVGTAGADKAPATPPKADEIPLDLRDQLRRLLNDGNVPGSM